MELQFLGTGAGQPSKQRNVSCVALKLLDELNGIWLFDVGEATQHQILRTNIRLRKITKIFISHNHGDHIFGLPGLLSTRSFQGDVGPLTIYGRLELSNLCVRLYKYQEPRFLIPLSLLNYLNQD